MYGRAIPLDFEDHSDRPTRTGVAANPCCLLRHRHLLNSPTFNTTGDALEEFKEERKFLKTDVPILAGVE
ncbi:MAG: hypothetical protein JO108_31935 [Acidobacteriaceae bacterium]|nr:hypothetical protein [Acidobacteriaceae bacterium]